MKYEITNLWNKPNPLDLKVGDIILAGELVPNQTHGRTADGLGKAISEEGIEYTLFYMDEENNEPIICPERDCSSSPYADHWRYIQKSSSADEITDLLAQHKAELLIVGGLMAGIAIGLSR